MTETYIPVTLSVKKRSYGRIFLVLITLVMVGGATFFYMTQKINTPPSTFPVGIDITVQDGMSQIAITKLLEEKGVVRSSLFLRYIFARDFRNSFIQAGVYHFDKPLSSIEVASSLMNGVNRSPELKITFPEGFKANELYEYLPPQLQSFEKRDLTEYEGNLFPDTYFVKPDISEDELLSLLTTTFDKKLAPYEPQIQQSGLSKDEVIILASIVEREAKDTTSKKMVAGILHNRLRINMPLQVDATFDYILDKASHELTDTDLEIDSPFNTYNNKGLPHAPIANPGLDAIQAVLEPTQSEYLYYLTGSDGTFHYAKTFEEHKKNKERYLESF